MAEEQTNASSARSKIPTRNQISAGGVAFRPRGAETDVAVVSVGPQARWQLPKGLIDPGETPDAAAVREVREEAGVETEMVAPIDTIEYWYVGGRGTERIRFHKYVHFFLLAFRSGHVSEHDREVNEARWVPLERAKTLLAFENERHVVEKAEALIEALDR